MSELKRTTCCGVRDYNGLCELRDPDMVMIDVYDRFYDTDEEREWSDGAFILFTCPASQRLIPRLVRFIEKHRLGTCTTTPAKKNVNSGHNLVAMLFAPSRTRYQDWYYKHVVHHGRGPFATFITR